MTRSRAVLPLALLLMGCSAPEPPEESVPPAPHPAAAAPSAPARAASPAAPSRPPALVRLSERRRGEDYASMGLTGANKPNGLVYRLRQSVPAEAPAFLPRERDGLALWIADPVPEGWLAFYREPLGLNPGSLNSRYRAALFGPAGERRWELALDPLLSRPSHLEIQDVRLHGGKLYLNEACQSYSREAEGRCSALVKVDPASGRVEWRTRPLVSSNVFLLRDPYVVTGYGFTDEPDSLHLVSQATGEVVASEGLDSAATYLEMVGGELAVVTTARAYRFRIDPDAATR